MRSLFRITLVLLVLGLGGYLSYSIYDQYLREKKPVEESGPDIRGEFNVFAGRNAIEVDDRQTIGTTVTVRAISIVDRGFVVILPSERYLLSDALGSSTLLTSGVYKNIKITLPEAPEGANNLQAVLLDPEGATLAATTFVLNKSLPPAPKENGVELYEPQKREVEVRIRERFGLMPNVIEANLGDTVVIRVKNELGKYEFSVPELGVQEMIPAATE